MKTFSACLPCLGNNALDYARRCTTDEATRLAMTEAAFHCLAEADKTMPPPYPAWLMRLAADKAVGRTAVDTYKADKERSTHLVKELLALLQKEEDFQHMDFERGLRLAAAGNILDFGIYTDLTPDVAAAQVRHISEAAIDTAAVRRLELAVKKAKRILYVLDNCGEAVFDGVFMAPWRHKVTLCVRKELSFNDVTPAELEMSGLGDLPYVTNGNGVNGLIPQFADSAFQEAYNAADLIIAKGQGNFECLNEISRPTGFIFLAKCPVITRLLNVPEKSIQVRTINL